MSFNGAGVYTLPAGNPVVTGTVISSTVQNTTMSDVATALSNCITRDGQSPATANIPMGAKQFTNLGAASGAGNALVYGGVIVGTTITGTDLTTTGNTILGDAVGDTLTVNATATFANNATVSGTLGVTGVATFTATPAGKVTSGFYTPVATLGANVSAATPGPAQWLRVGDVVTVSGAIDFSISGVAAAFLGISLPVASNFTVASHLGGIAMDGTNTSPPFEILGDFTNHRASFHSSGHSTGGTFTMYYTYTYRVV